MDFENMKRKELQVLCKEHGIPANLTNLEMANKLSSLLKANDEKPLTRGRSCLKILDENVNNKESDVVSRKVKKVKFSPDNEIFEFTRSAQVKRGGRRNSMLRKNNLDVGSDELKVGILDSPVRVTRSQRMILEDGVTEKKGRTRHVKDSSVSVNESRDEVGVTTRRSLRNKEVVIQEKREENEGVNDGLWMSRRVRSRKYAKDSAEDSQEELKMNELDKSTSEKEIDRAEKRDEKVTFTSDGQMNECTKSETKAKETKRERRKPMAHNQTLHVQSKVDAEVREEIAEKPARVTRSLNLKPVEDDVRNKRNRTRSKEAIEISEKLVCTEFVESSVEAVKDEVRINTRRSQQNNVVEAPQKALKRSGRLANNAKATRLTDDISKDKVVTRDKTRNQSNLTVEASTSESGTTIVEPKGKLEELVKVPLGRSDRRISVHPLEKLRGDEVAAKKEKRDSLNANDDEPRNKGTKEPQKALKRSTRLATQAEASVLVKDDIAENEVVDRGRTARIQSTLQIYSLATSFKTDRPTESQGTHEVVLQTVVPVRGNRRKSAVPSLEKVRKVAVVKEKRNLNANDDDIRSKGTKEEPQKASKRSRRLAKQMEDSVFGKGDIAENKLEERRCARRNANDDQIRSKGTKEPQKASKRSRRFAKQMEDSVIGKGDIAENKLEERRCARRNAAKANVDIKILDRSVQEEISVVKEERRCSGRSAARYTLAAVSDEKKENGEDKLTKRNYTDIQEKDSINKFALQDLDSLKQSTSSSNASVEAAVVEKTSTAEKKQQGRLKISNMEIEIPMLEDMEIVRESGNKDRNISGSEDTTSFSRSALNELESVPDDVNVVLAGTKDEVAAESSTLADKLNEEGPLVDANAFPSENNSTLKCLPFSDPSNTGDRPENLVEELLQSDHEVPASKGLCPSSVFVDDAVPDGITSEKLDHCAIAAANAEEFVTGLANVVLDNCSLSQSDNMEENLDSGTKDESAAELSTLADKLNEEGPLVDANASPYESTSKCLSLSDPFNSNARPEENLVEELLQSDHEEPASKCLCPSSVLADNAVPDDITSNKQEHGAIAAEEFDTGLSNEVLDNCSPSHRYNMEEYLDSGTKDEAAAESSALADKLIDEGSFVDANTSLSENNFTSKYLPFNSNARSEENLVEELLSSDHVAPASKDLCPSSVLADDAVPNDIASDKQEHGAVAEDNAEEFDTGLSNEILNCSVKQSDNMEENLDAGFKEQSDTGGIVTEGVTYGEQEPASKGLCPSSVLADDVVPNGVTSDNLEHCAIAADNAEEFDIGSSNEVLDNCVVDRSDNMKEKLDSGFKEQSETRCIVTAGGNYGEQELTVMDYAKEFDAGMSSNVSLVFNQSNEIEVKKSESGPMEQAEAEPSPMEAKYDRDAPTFTSQGDIHAEEYSNLEAAASEKTVSCPIKAVLDLQEPGICDDGIALHVTPSEDGDEEKQGELKILFATPCNVSHSKEKKASLDGDSRDEGLNRKGQVSPISGNDTSSFQSYVSDCGEHGQGEFLKSLFATPFGSRSRKVEIATCMEINETSSQYKHSCHENENTASSAGNGLTQSVTPLKDTSKDEAGEELKGSFALPSVVSQSVGGQRYLFQSHLSGEAMTTGERLGSNGKENLSESVGGLVEDTQGEHVRTLSTSPVSVKCTNQETTSTQAKYSQSHEMGTYICSGVKQNLGESEAGSIGVDQAPEISHITAFNYGDESEQEDQLKMQFASPINTQNLNQMDGTPRKTEDKKNLLSRNVQGLSHNKGFTVEHPSAMDLAEPESVYSRHSEEHIKVEKIKETADCMKEPSAVGEENNEGQGNMLSTTSAKNMTPLGNDEFSSQEPDIKETAECMKRSSVLEEENNEGRGNMLSATSAKNMTPLRNDEFSSQEPKTADVAMSGEMVRDTEMNTRQEIWVQKIVDIEEHKIEETVADRDLLLSDTSRGLEEDFAVISESTCNDIELSEQKIAPEIKKSSPESVKTSDVFNEDTEDHLKLLVAAPIKETSPSSPDSFKPSDAFKEENTEDHLKLLFATPIEGTSPSRLDEASSCQLKTVMIAMVSEMVGKEPKLKGFEFSGDPLTVEIISGGSDSTKRSCFSKEIEEQFKGGPLFPTPSKGASALQLEESTGCEEDIFKDLDYWKFLSSQEQKISQHEDSLILNEMTDDTGESTLHWFQQTNDGSVPRQTELETQKENDSALQLKPLKEKGEIKEDVSLAEGKEDDHLIASQESLEDRLINTNKAAKGGAVSDAVCQQLNILTDIETENIAQENIRKTDDISIFADECQDVFKEDDVAAHRDGLILFESNARTPMNVNNSGLTTQMDLPGVFAGCSGNTHSALLEEPQSESDQGKSSAANQQNENSFDEKEHESAVVSPSSKSRANISFILEGFAGEDTLRLEKKIDLAEKKVPLTPAGVAKTPFAKHLNSTVKKKNVRSILIHGTPNKLSQIPDMKENAPSVKGDIGTLTALRPEKRHALKILP